MTSPDDERLKGQRKEDQDRDPAAVPSPSRGEDRLGSELSRRLREGIPFLSPSFQTQVDREISNATMRIRTDLEANIDQEKKELQARLDDLKSSVIKDFVTQCKLEELFLEQSDLNWVVDIASRASIISFGHTGAVRVLVAENYSQILEGYPNSSPMMFGPIAGHVYKDSLSNETRNTFYSDTLKQEAGNRLPFLRTHAELGVYVENFQLVSGMPSFESLEQQYLVIAPIRYGDASLGLLIALRPPNVPFQREMVREIVYIAGATAAGIAHIKRMQDRANEGS